MSNDNLILFPKKSTPTIDMTNAEAKWMVSGTLLVVLTVALGINSALFSEKSNPNRNIAQNAVESSRTIASINPIFRVSWEKKAFEVLEKTKSRELANVGKKPSAFDSFAFGALEGQYQVRKIDGKISEVRFDDNGEMAPKTLTERVDFLKNNLALFSDDATAVAQIHAEDNDEVIVEKFELRDQQGQGLGQVQVLLNKKQELLSITVQ